MSRLTSWLIAVVSGAVTWFVYAWAAAKFGSPDPTWVASALLISVVFHELCHWAMMEKNGIKAHVIFLVIIGGAFPDPSGTEHFRALPWGTRTAIFLAGVIGNLALACGALLLAWVGLLSDKHLGQFVQLNAGLILFNLLPFGILDGGRFAKLLFDSVPEERDLAFAQVITIGAALGAIVSMIAFRNFPAITQLLFAVGAYTGATRDDPAGSYDRKAMHLRTCWRWTAVYIGLIVVSMLLTAATAGYRLLK